MTLLKKLKLSFNFNFIPVLVFLSCKEKSKDLDSLSNADGRELTISYYAVKVSMKGTIFQIKQKNLEPNSKTTFKKDSIFLQFREDNVPLQLNFNLTDANILETVQQPIKYQKPIQRR